MRVVIAEVFESLRGCPVCLTPLPAIPTNMQKACVNGCGVFALKEVHWDGSVEASFTMRPQTKEEEVKQNLDVICRCIKKHPPNARGGHCS